MSEGAAQQTENTEVTDGSTGAEGGATETPASAPWYDGAEDTVVGYIQNKGWSEQPLKAVEAYQQLEKFHGVPADRLVKLPEDMNDNEALSSIYDRLGRPESPDGYGEFNIPDEFKDVEVSKDRMAWADNMAHELGLNKSQRDALIGKTIAYEKEITEGYANELKTAQENEITELRKELGPAFEEHTKIAARAAKELGLEGVMADIEAREGSAAMIKAMHSIGTKLMEAGFKEGEGSSLSGTPTPQMAADEKASLLAEVGKDRNRMALYDKKQGKDYSRIKYLNDIINAEALRG